ncbi:MAG TPA: sulfotransferase [Allosphingosinicella sp.]|jgi:hypothetical protein|nr:sulfotransferase [Allosphingosinicella sp.]
MKHLIHIGYPKAGSTFLQRWFEQNPQLSFRGGGIAGFGSVFDVARTAALGKADVRYGVTSCENLSAPLASAGAEFVDYAADVLGPRERQRQACALLAGLFPDATVLIVTRGFASTILSNYSQYVRSGGPAPFEALVAHAAASGGEDGDSLVSVEHWDYDALIRDYEQAFGAGNVILLPYELLRSDPSAFLAEIERRLGLDRFPAAAERVNAALSAAELAWYPRLSWAASRLRPRRLSRLYRRLAFAGRLGPLVRVLQRVKPLDPVTPAMLPREVVERFRGRAERLGSEPLYAPYADEYLLERFD